uniref:Adenosine deaminase domain-containing protein n=1 Tax=Ciona savignyi TaxID=51511 RepID=H2YSF1_CIOSA
EKDNEKKIKNNKRLIYLKEKKRKMKELQVERNKEKNLLTDPVLFNEVVMRPPELKTIPKVELHAHLNGSLSEETILRLLSRKEQNGVKPVKTAFNKGEQRTMDDCFVMFRIIHQVVDCTEVVYEVTKDVISEFASEGTKYLELRSTPKAMENNGFDKRLYMEAVVGAIRDYNYNNPGVIDVRFLPSIDRGRSMHDAQENLKLAEEYRSTDLVSGVDLSGNPFTTDGHKFIPIMQAAKKLGLKTAVHLAEVKNKCVESKQFLSIPPDRIGHGTFLNDDMELTQTVIDGGIPLEICVTSNITSNTAPYEYEKHHLVWWRNQKFNNTPHPCVVCTDDKGVFSTNLSNEYLIVANALSLNRAETFNLSKEAIDHIFADENTKSHLRQTWEQAKHKLFN